MLVVPLKFMCSTQCETPVSPGPSSRDPTRYQHQTEASGALCTSWTSTFRPLSRIVSRTRDALLPIPASRLATPGMARSCLAGPTHYNRRYAMAEWKDTCNLPRTSFSMKANLQTAEPEAIARWDAMDLYGQIRSARKGAKRYLLHDGPPYANGEIHLGTALNKILKDMVVKSHNMLGFDAPYLPGWDCHGLPIELKVDRELGPKKRDMSIADFRRACRSYA